MRKLPFEPRSFPGLHRAVKKTVVESRKLFFESVRRLPGRLAMGLPRGTYSDYELLRASPPSLPGRIVLTDQGAPPSPPESAVVLSRRGQHTEQPWPVFWTHHHEVDLVGTSLAHLNKQGQVCREAVYGPHRALTDPAYNHLRRRRAAPVRLDGNWTSLVSTWLPTNKAQAYGHWVMEALPRLAFLPEFLADTRIIVPPFQAPYQIKSLQMLGLFDRCRWTTERELHVEDYYFSPPTAMIACYNPYSVEWLRRTFLPLVANTGGPTARRFFLRRVGTHRNMVNEEQVLDFFRALGWEIIDAATLDFAEQIRLFSQADAICGIHGSGFANLVWCKPGCRVLELFCQEYMCGQPEWIIHCIPSAQHRFLMFPGDHRLNARVDLVQLQAALDMYGMLER
jgi:capsular polysaccharide biosynthesis protein